MKIELLVVCTLLLSKTLLGESLEKVVVDTYLDSSSTDIATQTISAEDIQKAMKGNGFISSLLANNPNIKVTDNSKNSLTAGEITPGKISINGASFYQNNISVDGSSNNSIIDPALSNKFSLYDVPGNESEAFIDLDIIEEIKVLDSGVSAEYGGFLGGVIDVKTKRVRDEFTSKISYKTTSDELTSFHVSDKKTFKKASSENAQPSFKKDFFSTFVGSPINDSSGILLMYSKKTSIIPVAYFRSFKDSYRENQNFLLKYSYYFENDSILDIVLNHSPYESTHLSKSIKDSDIKLKGGGSSLKINHEKDLGGWEMKTNVAIKHSQNTKISKNYYKEWKISNSKPWGSLSDDIDAQYSKEGGSSSIKKTQMGIASNIKLSSPPIKKYGIKHKIKMGIDINYDKATYNRAEDTLYYTNAVVEPNVDCGGRNEGCVQNEQYFQNTRVYKKENISADMYSGNIYIQNQMKHSNFEFTPGLRFDYNNYLKNKDIAHRLNASYNLSKALKIYGGSNRYYGKSFLGYKLREARLPYYEQYRGTKHLIVEDWSLSANQDSIKYRFEDLKTPYSDELVVGSKYSVFGGNINLKYVSREAKDLFSSYQGDYEVHTRPDGITKAYYKPRYFVNEGRSSSQITSLTISSKKPLELSMLKLGYKLSTSWQKSENNIGNYNDIFEYEKKDRLDIVYYNGEFINRDEIEISKSPQYYNMNIVMEFKPINIFGTNCSISLNHALNYRLAYKAILPNSNNKTKIYIDTLPDGSTRKYDLIVYEDVYYKNNLIYDLKISFDFKIKEKHHILTNVEINNFFDKVQNVDNDPNNYKLGRQYWFSLAYKF